MIPVILAGGKGERFWPLSRKHRPKQFLCLDGSGKSLLQSTANRLLDLANGWDGLWVITASHLAKGVLQQLPELPEANLLVEMEGRDTAPAVAWATLEIAQRHGEDAIIGFFPADQWIGNQAALQETLLAAELAAKQGAIATLGISPTYASTGYGYIQQGESIGSFGGFQTYKVDRFTEKPDVATANSFLQHGGFSWNSGMFVFRAGVVLDELRRCAPDIIGPLEQHGPTIYPSLPKKSIDYALMEKTQKACVIPVTFSWDDLGDWNAIERLFKGDKPNVELVDHVCLDTKGSILHASEDGEVIVTIGLEDVVVVRDGSVTLIVHKNRTQEIKQVLKTLQDDPKFKDLL